LNAVIVVLILVAKKRKADERNIRHAQTGTYGTAHVANEAEIRDALDIGPLTEIAEPLCGKYGKDVVALPKGGIGKHVRLNYNKIVFGESSSGKTTCSLIPDMLQCIRRGDTVIAVDPKGDLYATTAEVFKREGYDVFVYATKRSVMPVADRWNPLSGVNGDPIRAQTVVQMLLGQGFSDIPKGDQYWNQGAAGLLKGLILFVTTNKKLIAEKKNNVNYVYQMAVDSSIETLSTLHTHIPSHHPAYYPLKTFATTQEMIKSNIRQDLSQRLEVFGIPEVARMTEVSDIVFERAAQKKTAIFMELDDQQGTFDFLSQLFFTFAFIDIVDFADKQDQRRCPVPVHFLIDEAGSLGRIPFLERKMSNIRSRGVGITLVFQNYAQIESSYPNQAHISIIGNASVVTTLGSGDIPTTEFFNKLSGIMTVMQETTRREERTIGENFNYHPSQNVSMGEGKRDVMNIDEVRRLLKAQKALTIVSGQNPIALDKFFYKEHFLVQGTKEVNVHHHVPIWKQEFEMSEDRRLRDEERDDITTWRYHPLREEWTYKDGEPIIGIRDLPEWNPRTEKWLIRGLPMKSQLEPPVFSREIWFYRENTELELLPQPPRPIAYVESRTIKKAVPSNRKNKPVPEPESLPGQTTIHELEAAVIRKLPPLEKGEMDPEPPPIQEERKPPDFPEPEERIAPPEIIEAKEERIPQPTPLPPERKPPKEQNKPNTKPETPEKIEPRKNPQKYNEWLAAEYLRSDDEESKEKKK
jgi:type IV secretion system protein VirD4